MKRRDLLKATVGATGALVALRANAFAQPPSQAPAATTGKRSSRSLGASGLVVVERVDQAGNGQAFQATLFVNAAVYQAAKSIQGPVDIGVMITLLYTSGGRTVALQPPGRRLGSLQATPLDSQTMRMTMVVPAGASLPDAGTRCSGRAQLVTVLPGNVHVPFASSQ
jgi:hypothetical protein